MGEDILLPDDGPKKRRNRTWSPALQRVAERSLQVDDADLRTYLPTEFDLRIAESMLGGCLTFKEIAEDLELCPTAVSRILKDPLRCSWVAQTCHQVARKRIGLVDMALLRKAVTGDVRAIDLYYKRFGETINRSVVLTASMDYDPSKLSDEDLDLIVKSELSKRATDATFEVKETNGNPKQAPPPAPDPGPPLGDSDSPPPPAPAPPEGESD